MSVMSCDISGAKRIDQVEKALKYIQDRGDEFGLQILAITRATGGLLRKGVTFIVQTKDESTDLLNEVPIRVEGQDIVQYRFCNKETLHSWKRKRIQPILPHWCTDWNVLIMKAAACLRVALNAFRRKQEHFRHLKRSKLEKLHRRKERFGGFNRPDLCIRSH